MWSPLTTCTVTFFLAMGIYAGHVAINANSKSHRDNAYRVLRLACRPLVLVVVVGSGAAAGLAKLVQTVLT